MAARQAIESRHALRAASLLGVLVLAKVLTLIGRPVPLSIWAPIAYFWQDVLVTLTFFVADAILRRSRLLWVVYGFLVAYVALNVGVTLELSSPLTWTLLRAARGPMADSVAHALTFGNVASIALVLIAGAGLPFVITRLRPAMRMRLPAIAAAIVFIVGGPSAVARVDTMGLHRNAVGALFGGGLPRVAAASANVDWRTSPWASTSRTDDLTRLRGSARGRNVIVIVLESTAAQYLRTYGASADPAPHLSALAHRALVIEQAYTVYPESIKGLFAAACSRYPAFATSPEAHSMVECDSLARVLRREGYRSALFHSGRFAYLGMDAIVQRQGFDVLEDAGAMGGDTRSSFGVDEPSAVRRILGWIDALPDRQRFFVNYLPVAGHHPYASSEPGPFDERDEVGRYKNALHAGDAALGQLLAGLHERHLDENTLLVIYGDHGEAFGQHAGNYGHTLSIYDENVRVPLMFVVPGVQIGVRSKRVASVIDVAPTVLDLLGLSPAPSHQGWSLLASANRMALFFTDYSLGWLGLRDDCAKYLFEVDSGRSKLYDVCRDPGETRDLAPAEPDRVAAYRTRLEEWAAAQREAITLPSPGRNPAPSRRPNE